MENAKKIFKIQAKITDLRLKIQQLNIDKRKNIEEIKKIEAEISKLSA